MSDLSTLCLGTVKLGLSDYGFSSSQSDPTFDAQSFLAQVEKMGIYRFDTSPRYGHSEKVLGHHFANASQKRIVSTKIDGLSPNSKTTPQKMYESVTNSLSVLGINKIDICYLHQNELDILSDPYVQDGLQTLKSKKLILATGASLYSMEECHYAISSAIFDYVQIPINICDVSFYDRFVKPNQTQVKFVARSLLLQGIILNRKNISQRIQQAPEIFNYLQLMDEIAHQAQMPLQQLALAFVFQLKNLHHHIIGTTNTTNLQKNINALHTPLPPNIFNTIYEQACLIKDWANPRNW